MPAGGIYGEGVELGMCDNSAVKRPRDSSGKAGSHSDNCDIDVCDGQSQQCVPDRAANKVCLRAVNFRYGCDAA